MAVLRGKTGVSSLSEPILGTVVLGMLSRFEIACASAAVGTEYGCSMQYCSYFFLSASLDSLLSFLLHEILRLFAHTPQLSSLFTFGH